MSLDIILLGLLFLFFIYVSQQKGKNKKEILTLIFTFGLIVYYHHTESPINIKISSSGITLENRSKQSNQKKYGRNKVTAKMKKIVASSQNWKCAICLNMLDATYEVDHIIPLYKGGNNEMLNLQALCRNCHGKKTLNDSL